MGNILIEQVHRTTFLSGLIIYALTSHLIALFPTIDTVIQLVALSKVTQRRLGIALKQR